MNDRTHWNPWTSAADLLDPLRTVLNSVRSRRTADVERREPIIDQAPRCSDAEILERVVRRIAADEYLRGSDVHVDAVYDGVVWLGGSVADAIAHARAFEDAANVPGVRRVASEITTNDAQHAA